MKKILREPLLHFLLLGAAIFAGYSLVSRPDGRVPDRIVVSSGQIAAMAEGFARTWRRPPTGEELDGLIRDRVQEEVYSREALALGLDRDDTIIRRRLRQKMEFLTDDVAALAEPTEAELAAYLEANPEAFRVQQSFTFSHVYLNPGKHGDNLARDAGQLLAQLRQEGSRADIAERGDSFLLEHRFQSQPAGEVTKLFGEKFTQSLRGLTPGQWEGPVESGYGQHLVWISERTDGRVPALAEIRDAVRREWANTRRLAANEKFYAELLKRYVVTIEPAPEPRAKQVAAK